MTRVSRRDVVRLGAAGVAVPWVLDPNPVRANDTSSDDNGFRPNPGAPVSFRRSSPPFAVAMEPPGPDRRPALETHVTDGSSGRAPDLGALELGAIPPHYGPRR